jgi:hypothetical protein
MAANFLPRKSEKQITWVGLSVGNLEEGIYMDLRVYESAPETTVVEVHALGILMTLAESASSSVLSLVISALCFRKPFFDSHRTVLSF